MYARIAIWAIVCIVVWLLAGLVYSALTWEKEKVLILNILRIYKPKGLFGLEIAEASRGMLRRGTVYEHLSRMEDEGLIHSWLMNNLVDQKQLPRRLYSITEAGNKYLMLAESNQPRAVHS